MPSTGTPTSTIAGSHRGASALGHALRPARQDDAGRLPGPQRLERRVEGHDLGVDRQLAQAARDELGVLRPEIQDDDGLMRHGEFEKRRRRTPVTAATGSLLYVVVTAVRPRYCGLAAVVAPATSVVVLATSIVVSSITLDAQGRPRRLPPPKPATLLLPAEPAWTVSLPASPRRGRRRGRSRRRRAAVDGRASRVRLGDGRAALDVGVRRQRWRPPTPAASSSPRTRWRSRRVDALSGTPAWRHTRLLAADRARSARQPPSTSLDAHGRHGSATPRPARNCGAVRPTDSRVLWPWGRSAWP